MQGKGPCPCTGPAQGHLSHGTGFPRSASSVPVGCSSRADATQARRIKIKFIAVLRLKNPNKPNLVKNKTSPQTQCYERQACKDTPFSAKREVAARAGGVLPQPRRTHRAHCTVLFCPQAGWGGRLAELTGTGRSPGGAEGLGWGGWGVGAVQSSFNSSCISDAGQEGTVLSQGAPNLPPCLLQTQRSVQQLLPLGLSGSRMWKPDGFHTLCASSPSQAPDVLVGTEVELHQHMAASPAASCKAGRGFLARRSHMGP